jgi:tetratricopeptide (TPR) repeat protein
LLLAFLLYALASDLSDAQAALARGDKEAARELLWKARKEEEDAAVALRMLAKLAAEGDTRAESTLTGMKTSAEAKAALGYIAFYRNKPEAEVLFAEALSLQPDYALALVGKGQWEQAQGKLSEGLATIYGAAKANPSASWLQRDLSEARKLWFSGLLAALSGSGNDSLKSSVPVPLDSALHRLIDESFGIALFQPVPPTTASALGSWLLQNKDPCGAAIAEAWNITLRTRTTGQSLLTEELTAVDFSSCPASEDRNSWKKLRLAGLQIWVEDPSAGLKLLLETPEIQTVPRQEAESLLLTAYARYELQQKDACKKAANQAAERLQGWSEALVRAQALALACGENGISGLEKMADTADDLLLVELLLLSAPLRASQGDTGKALAELDSAARLAKELEHSRFMARADLEIARIYRLLKESTPAKERAAAAIAAYARLGDTRLEAAATLELARLGESPESNLKRVQALLGNRIFPEAGYALVEKARLDPKLATASLNQAEAVFTALELPSGKQLVASERARLDPTAALLPLLPRYGTSLSGWSKIASLYSISIDSKKPGSGLLALGKAALSKHELARAAEAMEAALEQTSLEDPIFIDALLGAGDAWGQVGYLERAIGALESAHTLAPATDARLPAIKLLLARYAIEAGKLELAQTAMTGLPDSLDTKLLTARLLAAKGDSAGALAILSGLQKTARQAADTRTIAVLLVELLRLGQSNIAVEALVLADNTKELALRWQARCHWLLLPTPEPRLGGKLPELFLETRLQHWDSPEGWTLSLRARLARIAAGLFKAQSADKAWGILASPEYQGSQASLWQELAALRATRIERERDPFPPETVTASLVDAAVRLDALDGPLDAVMKEPAPAGKLLLARQRAAYRQAEAAWMALIPGYTGTTVELIVVQQTLKAWNDADSSNTILLSWHPLEDGSLVAILVSATDFQIKLIEKDELPLGTPSLEDLKNQLQSRIQGTPSDPDILLPSLSAWLFSTFPLPAQARLLLVPQGWLNAVPFAALPMVDGQILLDQHLFTLLPSLTWFLQAHRASTPNDTPSMLAFGPPPSSWTGASCPGVCEKADAAAWEKLSKQHDYIEIRFQAVDAASPYPSSPSASYIAADTTLYAHRLAHLPARTELILLPFLKISGLEGAGGLASALLTGRVQTVLWSRWGEATVAEEVTEKLRKAFNEQEGAWWKASALSQAQKELRNKNPDPWSWASFVISGDPG